MVVASWVAGCDDAEGVSCVEGVTVEGFLWVTVEGCGGVLVLVGVLSLGAGVFGGSSPFFFLLLRVIGVHSLLVYSGVTLMASVVLIVSLMVPVV